MQVDISDGPTALNRVLILEDEALVAMLIEDIVRDLGATEVHIYGDAEAAKRAAQEHQLDCAILDVVVRDGHSGEVADILHERGIPFVFSTGSGRESLVERHRNRPMIIKPFPDSDLVALLKDVLTGRAGNAVPAE